jgi:hypothetical protein
MANRIRFGKMVRKEKEKATNALSRIYPGIGLRGWIIQQDCGFSLMAALVLVLVVPVFMNVFMAVNPSLVLMFLPIVAVGTALVAMLVLMFVLVVAAHRGSTSFFFFL